MSIHDCDRYRAELIRGAAANQPPDPWIEVHALGCASCREFREREEQLDALLDLLPQEEGPEALAEQVRLALALDVLLDDLPEPSIPVGLAERVLHGLAPHRRPRRLARQRWITALAAAGLLLAFLLWRKDRAPEPVEPQVVDQPKAPDARLANATSEGFEEDEDLLAYALERWELLEDDDLDLWLAGLDPVEQTLMEVAGPGELSELEAQGGLDAPR